MRHTQRLLLLPPLEHMLSQPGEQRDGSSLHVQRDWTLRTHKDLMSRSNCCAVRWICQSTRAWCCLTSASRGPTRSTVRPIAWFQLSARHGA